MRAVMLLSGGLDSMVCLAEAVQKGSVELCIFFDYGQRAYEPEWAAARQVAAHYGIPIRSVELGWFGKLLPEQMAAAGAKHPKNPLDAWIPNRNGVFVNIAAAFAEALGCDTVLTGFNKDEAAQFSDNSQAFVEAANVMLSYSTQTSVKVASFTAHMSKREMVERGVAIKAPLLHIYSCYSAGPLMCGTCPSCTLLKSALYDAGCATLLAERFKDGSEIRR